MRARKNKNGQSARNQNVGNVATHSWPLGRRGGPVWPLVTRTATIMLAAFGPCAHVTGRRRVRWRLTTPGFAEFEKQAPVTSVCRCVVTQE
uniref:Uncharacterized protein n=1 Tax=Romanomermis culicivorax TaxID=13658 RepID=A0A915IVV1_ROMCU